MELDPTGGPGDGLFPRTNLLHAQAEFALLPGQLCTLAFQPPGGDVHTGMSAFGDPGTLPYQPGGVSVLSTVSDYNTPGAGNAAKAQSYPFLISMDEVFPGNKGNFMVAGYHPRASVPNSTVQGSSMIPNSANHQRLALANNDQSKVIAIALSAPTTVQGEEWGPVLFDGLNGFGHDPA